MAVHIYLFQAFLESPVSLSVLLYFVPATRPCTIQNPHFSRDHKEGCCIQFMDWVVPSPNLEEYRARSANALQHTSFFEGPPSSDPATETRFKKVGAGRQAYRPDEG